MPALAMAASALLATASAPFKGGDLEHGLAGQLSAVGGKYLPSKTKLMSVAGKVTEVTFGGAVQFVHCLGLPEPPGGWYGPFGFFRLLSYVFGLMAVCGVVFALICLMSLDGFGFFASALLCFAAVVSAVAAYAHEGLANEVTAMTTQNDLFAKKNEILQHQIKKLGGVAEKMAKIQKDLGINEQKLKDTIDALHRQTSIQQLASMLTAFCEADREGDKDQRLTASEVEDFFDSSDAILRGACPTFDFAELKQMALTVGIGLYAMRLMVNALIAAGDDNPHKSTAELSLVMFCFDPEGHMESCVNNLRLVLPDDLEDLRGMLEDVKTKHAMSDQHGRIPCKEVHHISHRVMTCEPPLVGEQPGVDEATTGECLAQAA